MLGTSNPTGKGGGLQARAWPWVCHGCVEDQTAASAQAPADAVQDAPDILAKDNAVGTQRGVKRA